MKLYTFAGVAAGVWLALGAMCSSTTDPIAAVGGDDFPNMIAAAGKTIALNLEPEKQNPADVDANPLSLMKSGLPVPTQLSVGAAKQKAGAQGDTMYVKYDMSTGNSTFVRQKTTLLAINNDTVVFRLNGRDTIIVSMAGSIQHRIQPYVNEYFRLTDLDGDGFLVNASAARQQALGYVRKTAVNGNAEVLIVSVDAGNNGSFADSTDNAIIAVTSLQLTAAGDTTYYVRLTDADGDGHIARAGAAKDSSLVDIMTFYEMFPRLTQQRRHTSSARMVVFPGDSSKNYPVRYAVVNSFVTRLVSWNIATIKGDSTFYPGDTVDIVRIATPFAGDSLSADTLVMRAKLGSKPNDSLDDALLSIYLHTIAVAGEQRECLFTFTAHTPVMATTQPVDGGFTLEIVTPSKAWLSCEGTIGENTLSATVATSTNRNYNVIWNRDGTLQSIHLAE